MNRNNAGCTHLLTMSDRDQSEYGDTRTEKNGHNPKDHARYLLLVCYLKIRL